MRPVLTPNLPPGQLTHSSSSTGFAYVGTVLLYVPSGQRLHAVVSTLPPVVFEYLPRPHALQDKMLVSPSCSVQKPMGHLLHAVTPLLPEYCPPGQLMQSLAASLPVVVRNLPSVQRVHSANSTGLVSVGRTPLYVPARQRLQADSSAPTPSWSEYRPFPHTLHEVTT